MRKQWWDKAAPNLSQTGIVSQLNFPNFGVAVNMATAGTEEGDSLEEKDEPENYSQFIVIGGGISGLSAASHLSKNGFNDFKLLEARNRLGGRIATMQLGEWQCVALFQEDKLGI